MSAGRKRFVRSYHFIGLASRGKSVLERGMPFNSLIYPASFVSFGRAILIGLDVHGDISIPENIMQLEQFVRTEARNTLVVRPWRSQREMCINVLHT